jgi:hypothetical protein
MKEFIYMVVVEKNHRSSEGWRHRDAGSVPQSKIEDLRTSKPKV